MCDQRPRQIDFDKGYKKGGTSFTTSPPNHD